MVKFVRLACLMCAASVYPEPGSNSHVYCIYIVKYKSKLIFILVFFQVEFLTLGLLYQFGSTNYYRLVLKGYCLLFNVLFSCSRCLPGTLFILAQQVFFVNTFF